MENLTFSNMFYWFCSQMYKYQFLFSKRKARLTAFLNWVGNFAKGLHATSWYRVRAGRGNPLQAEMVVPGQLWMDSLHCRGPGEIPGSSQSGEDRAKTWRPGAILFTYKDIGQSRARHLSLFFSDIIKLQNRLSPIKVIMRHMLIVWNVVHSFFLHYFFLLCIIKYNSNC